MRCPKRLLYRIVREWRFRLPTLYRRRAGRLARMKIANYFPVSSRWRRPLVWSTLPQCLLGNTARDSYATKDANRRYDIQTRRDTVRMCFKPSEQHRGE